MVPLYKDDILISRELYISMLDNRVTKHQVYNTFECNGLTEYETYWLIAKYKK